MAWPGPVVLRARKRPTAGRCFILVFVLGSASAGSAAAASPEDAASAAVETGGSDGLTADEAVERALARPVLDEIAEGAIGALRADAVKERQWPNPEVGYSREQVFGTGGGAQDFGMVSQEFDLSGRRELRGAAAERRAGSVAWLEDARLQEIEAAVRLRFYELLVAQRAGDATGMWIRLIERALAAVSRREAGGDASAYDRWRLERELANAVAVLAEHGAEAERAWALLAALLGEAGGGPPTASGILIPEPRQLDETVRTAIERRPDIRALDESAAAAELEIEASGRWWVPQFELGVGWTGIDSGAGRADGYVLGLTLAVPLFDRHEGERLRAEAEALRVRGVRDLLVAETLAGAAARAAEVRRLVEAAVRFREEAVAHSAELIGAAELGFAAGEVSIIELLDAYRGARDDKLTALDLEFAARVARIRLDLLLGGSVP